MGGGFQEEGVSGVAVVAFEDVVDFGALFVGEFYVYDGTQDADDCAGVIQWRPPGG